MSTLESYGLSPQSELIGQIDILDIQIRQAVEHLQCLQVLRSQVIQAADRSPMLHLAPSPVAILDPAIDTAA